MQQVETIPQDVAELATELGIGDKFEAIFELTQQMFPGPVSLETGYDPEWPEDRWIAFDVEASGTFQEIIQRECAWHRELVNLIPGRLGAVCISVFPR